MNSTAKSVPLGQMTEIVDAVMFQFVWCMNSSSNTQATCPFEVGQKHADANVLAELPDRETVLWSAVL